AAPVAGSIVFPPLGSTPDVARRQAEEEGREANASPGARRDRTSSPTLVSPGVVSPDEHGDYGGVIVEARRADGRRGVAPLTASALPRLAPLPSIRRWQSGDAVLLVTDGVSDRVVVDELASIVLDAGDAETAVRGIVACALEAGGNDNATAMVVQREA